MYVHLDLVAALAAVHRQRVRLGVQVDPLGFAVAAVWANQKASDHCQQCITPGLVLQDISTSFPKNNILTKAKKFNKKVSGGVCIAAAVSCCVPSPVPGT